MDAQEALRILSGGAMYATMIFLPGGGKRVVADADRTLYAEAEKILQEMIDDAPVSLLDRERALNQAEKKVRQDILNQGRTEDGPTASVGHDHERPEIRHDVCEGEGQGERPGLSGLGESGTSSACDTDGVDPQAS